MAAKILVVEDEAPVRDMICFALNKAEYDCLGAKDAEDARRKVAETPPDLILMDWMLPEMSGIELTRELKGSELTREIPVIMLTARGEEDDKVRGLESGVEDYVTKPFSPRELMARIKVILRRVSPNATDEVITAGDLSLNPASHRVEYVGKEIELGPTEFKLLHFFMTHPDRVFSRSRLLDRVWGTNVYIEERTVDVHIRRLRMALEPFFIASMIQTVRGAGYRFSDSHA
jgi:two-component system, OmpR family, phosphate regulon response regulator PhoB